MKRKTYDQGGGSNKRTQTETGYTTPPGSPMRGQSSEPASPHTPVGQILRQQRNTPPPVHRPGLFSARRFSEAAAAAALNPLGEACVVGQQSPDVTVSQVSLQPLDTSAVRAARQLFPGVHPPQGVQSTLLDEQALLGMTQATNGKNMLNDTGICEDNTSASTIRQ